MKGFIEVTLCASHGEVMLNVNHIICVIGNNIFTDEVSDNCVECIESYSEIKEKIERAMK